jgi:hypothetical protein
VELLRPLGILAEAPGAEQLQTARGLGLSGEPRRAEYTELFLVQLFPYASAYLNPNGQLDGSPHDHLASLLKTYADLSDDVRPPFFWSQLATWLPIFTARVRELGSPFYRGWATVLDDALEAEAVRIGPPTVLPMVLSSTPKAAFAGVDFLFAPVLSGIILTRADLARCIRDLGLDVRVSERRYTLSTMLGQDRTRTSAWLSGEAARQAERMANAALPFRMITEYWQQRAVATAKLLQPPLDAAAR